MKRLNDQSGFTLAETLLAILILLLVSTIVATGVPAARNAYEKVIVGANAQTMLSTAVTSLRDELGTAWQVKLGKKPDGTDVVTTIEYFKASTGAYAKISLDDESADTGRYPAILLQDYVALDEKTALINNEVANSKARHLVPDKNTDLYVTYDSIALDPVKSVITVNGLQVRLQKDKEKRTIAGLEKLEIRLLSEDFA